MQPTTAETDPRPVADPAGGHDASAPASRSAVVTAGPALVLMSLGLMLVAQAAATARNSGASAIDQVLYVAGLLIVFLPAAAGVLLPRVAGSTRVLLAVTMLVLLQVARLVVDPSRFAQPVALLQLDALDLIQRTDTLSVAGAGANPLAPLLPFYPGLLVATDAVGDLTGLGAHTSGVVVLLAARMVTALAVLLLVAWVTRSTRIGAVAVVVYALDPRLPVLGSLFDSPTLALALAVLTVYLVLSRRRGSRISLVPAVLAVWAVVATHHLTAVALVVVLLVWAALELVLRRGKPTGEQTGDASSALAAALTAVAGVVGLVVSLDVDGNPASLLRGGSTGFDSPLTTLFDHADVLRSVTWAWLLIVASLVLTLLAVGIGLLRARGLARDRSTLGIVLLALAVAFPVVLLVGVLVSGARGAVDASTALVYLGVAGVVATWVWWTPARDARAWVLTAGAGVVFVGSLLLGGGRLDDQLPGDYRPGDATRSLDPANVAAAEWMATGLPAGSVVYGDRAAVLLAGTIGRQTVLVDPGPETARLLLDPGVDDTDAQLVRDNGIDYLVVDRRDATALPAQGFYVDPSEAEAGERSRPASEAALDKFATEPGVDMVYDNGSIVIYDLRGLDVD